MELLLIRHGSTAGNQTHRHQPENGRLTEVGRAQAANAAKYVLDIQPTHFISSTHVRALETAAIIGTATDMIPSTSKRYAELHRPHYMYGQFHRSFGTARYLAGWFLGLVGSDTAVDTNGESYHVFQARVATAAHDLSTYPANARIALVTHAVFIAFLVHHLTTGHRVYPWQLPALLKSIFTIKNGSATHLRFDSKTGRWQVVGYLDGTTTVMK